eukprot:366039-Chlamydomonas_euryale.AAC.3
MTACAAKQRLHVWRSHDCMCGEAMIACAEKPSLHVRRSIDWMYVGGSVCASRALSTGSTTKHVHDDRQPTTQMWLCVNC